LYADLAILQGQLSINQHLKIPDNDTFISSQSNPLNSPKFHPNFHENKSLLVGKKHMEGHIKIKKDLAKSTKSLFLLAGTTRLELATSGVTDLHMPPMNTGFQQLTPARESSEYIRVIPFGVRFGVRPK
jgi:hypothetical protein